MTKWYIATNLGMYKLLSSTSCPWKSDLMLQNVSSLSGKPVIPIEEKCHPIGMTSFPLLNDNFPDGVGKLSFVQNDNFPLL